MLGIVSKIKGFIKNKEINNASWLIGGKVLQMIISFVVSIISARFLGPDNYGLINYGLAYTTFFVSICNLGINNILVKEFITNPDDVGESIGTTIGLRLVSSLCCYILIMLAVNVLDHNDASTIAITALCSVQLFFQISEVFNYWFQAQYMSKVVSITSLIAYMFVAAYKIVLLVLRKSVYWFAFANSLDLFVYGIIIMFFYRKYGGQKLRFSLIKGKSLLRESYHYILSAAMIAVYMQTDKLMIKQMISAGDVGCYSVASNLCSIWVFVLAAIIDSLYPTIISLFNDGKHKDFNRKNRQLYCIVFYTSVCVSFFIMIFSKLIINILYGEAYSGSIGVLRVLTWYTAFSYLGVARNAWLVCKHAQKYLKYIYIIAAGVNVLLNFLLIPILGAVGAALASLITQVFTSIILPMFFRDTRENSKLMIEAIMFKGLRDM